MTLHSDLQIIFCIFQLKAYCSVCEMEQPLFYYYGDITEEPVAVN